MTIWQIILLAYAVAFLHVALLATGAGIALWAYYHGSRQTNPIPRITNPVASLFRSRPGMNGDGAGEHDDEPGEVPASIRRA